MVNTLRAPKLTFATDDPWKAWKQTADPYTGQVTQGAPWQGTQGVGNPNLPNDGWNFWRQDTVPDPSGQRNTTTTTINGGPGVGVKALAPIVAGQAKPGLPETGAPGVGNAPIYTPPKALSALGQGAGNAAVAEGAPSWARFTAGNTGASFANIAKSFDPWGNWGQYGPNQANAPKRHQNGGGMESDIDRVYRWTNDILRTQYGLAGGEAADPALRTQIFLANVERLRSEYQQAGLDWNTSAFADMERGEALMRGTPPASMPPYQGGGTEPFDPTGKVPYSPPGTTPPPVGPPATGNGQGSGPVGGGGGGIFPSEVEMELARQSPEYAIAAYRKARGGGQDKSAVGDFREGMMGQAVRAYLTMLGAGGAAGNPVNMANQGMGDIINALASGNGVGGILRQQAQQMMGQDLSGFDDKQLLAMFGAAQGAGGFGLGPFAQYALDNSYGDMEHLAQQHALSGQTTSALANPAARQKFMADLARYLAVR